MSGGIPTVTVKQKTLLGAVALCQRGGPPLSDSAVLPVPGAVLNAGKAECIARAVSPLGGRDGAKRGWR